MSVSITTAAGEAQAADIFLNVVGSAARYKVRDLAEVAARSRVPIDDFFREVRIGYERAARAPRAEARS